MLGKEPIEVRIDRNQNKRCSDVKENKVVLVRISDV